MHSQALHLLARARGSVALPAGASPTPCAVCGLSPFPVGAPTAVVFGDNFASWGDLVAPASREVCAGCLGLLAGRPGDDPPPLRTMHCLAVEGAPALYPDTASLHRVLLDPPLGRFVVLWAASRKKHASLHAHVSTPARIVVGSDDGPIEYVPLRDRPRLDAVATLVSSFARSTVAAGDYSAPAIAAFGATAWARLEEIVAPIRGTPLLDMLCALAPKGEAPDTEDLSMLDPMDDLAADLLAGVAHGSRERQTNGLVFWRGFFRHRVERFKRLPLADMLSRLLDVCRCAPLAPSTRTLLDRVAALSPEETAGVERAIRDRGALVVALAFQRKAKDGDPNEAGAGLALAATQE